jgi:hypothetical protein
MFAEVYVAFDKPPVSLENVDSWKIDEDNAALIFEDDNDGTIAAFNTWLYFRFVDKLDS